MIAERMGKAIRTPARDAMLSHATAEMGRGWGFGLHEALDQIGAMLGPLIVAAVLYFRGSYQAGFAVLSIPAVLALSVLMAARFLYPTPRDLESKVGQLATEGLPCMFWFYLAAAGLVAAGYADFPLISYHFGKTSSVPEVWVPVVYSIAMGVDALAALIFGRLFDRAGISILIVAVLLSTLFAPFVFWGRVLCRHERHGAVGSRDGCPGIRHASRYGRDGPLPQTGIGLRRVLLGIRTVLVFRECRDGMVL